MESNGRNGWVLLMKTHHLGNLILVAVIIVALGSLYFMYTSAGRAWMTPPEVSQVIQYNEMNCCCVKPYEKYQTQKMRIQKGSIQEQNQRCKQACFNEWGIEGMGRGDCWSNYGLR